MFSDTELRDATRPHTTDRLWIWQALCAGLFLVWIITLSFAYFKAQLVEGQYLLAIKGDLVQAVQSLAQSQQQVNQRLQALEKGKSSGPSQPEGTSGN